MSFNNKWNKNTNYNESNNWHNSKKHYYTKNNQYKNNNSFALFDDIHYGSNPYNNQNNNYVENINRAPNNEEKTKYTERLRQIYQQHCSYKTDNIPNLINKYSNSLTQLHALYTKCCRKYNVQPMNIFISNTSSLQYNKNTNTNQTTYTSIFSKQRNKPQPSNNNTLNQNQVKLKVTAIGQTLNVKVLTYMDYYNSEYNFAFTATLFDFLHRWETQYGVDIGKTKGTIIPSKDQQKFAKVISENINPDTPLKNLINKDIEWYSYQPGYENNSVKYLSVFNANKQHIQNRNTNNKMSIQQQQSAKYRYIYRVDTVVNLDKLFKCDINEYNKLEWCLCNRGWVSIEFPVIYQNDILNCSKIIGDDLLKYMKNKNEQKEQNGYMDDYKEWKTICNNFGYTHFKDYKSVLRVYTNQMFQIFKNEYPNKVRNSIEKVSNIMDVLSRNIIVKTINLWLGNTDKNKKVDIKMLDELCLNNNGFGMIDYVIYKNNKEKKDKKYNMLEKGNNVDSHIDPGLFSISFLQINQGLQLLDQYAINNKDKKWIRIPEYKNGRYGILWTGQYAFKMNNQLKCGIHRVDYNHNKPRLTGWYEACIKSQIPNKVFQKTK